MLFTLLSIDVVFLPGQAVLRAGKGMGPTISAMVAVTWTGYSAHCSMRVPGVESKQITSTTIDSQ